MQNDSISVEVAHLKPLIGKCYIHIGKIHHGGLVTNDFNVDDPDPAFQLVYKANKEHIFARHEIGTLKRTLNFPTKDYSRGYAEISEHLEDIYKEQKTGFKINLSFGFVMQDLTQPDNYRYYLPGENQMVLDAPFYISKKSQIRHLINKLKKIDLREMLRNERHNSKYQAYYITNLNYMDYNTNYPLGYVTDLPVHILRKKSLVALIRDCRGDPYKDYKCIFRALCYHQIGKVDNKRINQYIKVWKAISGYHSRRFI